MALSIGQVVAKSSQGQKYYRRAEARLGATVPLRKIKAPSWERLHFTMSI